jgi:branched-chain amino acid aminotransferase
MNFICFNGTFLASTEPLFNAQNRSFRYGDGLFETMKIFHGKIFFEEFHYERLFLSLKMLQIKIILEPETLSQMILDLCRKNHCDDCSRVRVAFFRNHQNTAEFVIEAYPLTQQANQWNEKGLAIDLYPYARKNPDAFSNLKTANFLPYVLAELFAKERGLDDTIVLNTFNHLADTTKANIFLVMNKEIFTPALNQGCIAGIMRRFLLEQFKKNNYRVHQHEISQEQLLVADEVFLTNSIFDMRWVEKFRDKIYSHGQVFSLYQQIISPLY